jgi:hypothetical protein
VKYLSEDKHQEAIYNEYSWEFDYSDMNGASYNFWSSLIDHTILDVIPYYYFWGWENDSTTQKQRILQTFK